MCWVCHFTYLFKPTINVSNFMSVNLSYTYQLKTCLLVLGMDKAYHFLGKCLLMFFIGDIVFLWEKKLHLDCHG
jgi:hypothetical protein